MMEVGRIAELLNGRALELARELLPNGRHAGNYWMFSGMADTGRSESAWVYLTGDRIGQWQDAGNAAAGEERCDMLDLLQCKLGLDKAGAVAEAKRRLGIVDDWHGPRARSGAGGPARVDPEQERRLAAEARARAEARERQMADDRARRAKGAKAIYLRGVPIKDTPAEAYLRGRGLHPGPAGDWPNVLRFAPDVHCGPTGDKRPAMLAAAYDAQGTFRAVHRTFLEPGERPGSWRKLSIDKPKLVYGSGWGGFIPIAKGSSGRSMRAMPDGEPIYMAEGIEKCLAIRMAQPGARIICSMNLPNMGAVVLPAAARRLVLVADRDDNERAQAQLERVLAQQQARGLEVALVLPPADCINPATGQPVKDIDEWLNVLRAGQQAAGRHAWRA
jgi:hypothetical protein